MRIFLDCDGVLADFGSGVRLWLGEPADDAALWRAAALHGSFFRDLPPMPDAHSLVGGVRARGFEPAVLTGVPSEVPDAAEQKRAWLGEHFPGVEMITCPSRDKSLHGEPGDVLVDDRPKYRALWEAAGGVWITHRSADESLRQIDVLVTHAFGRLSRET